MVAFMDLVFLEIGHFLTIDKHLQGVFVIHLMRHQLIGTKNRIRIVAGQSRVCTPSIKKIAERKEVIQCFTVDVVEVQPVIWIVSVNR